MLVEVIFRGLFSVLDFSFLKKLLIDAKEVRFNYPETNCIKNFDEAFNVIILNTYVDLVINTDYLEIEGRNVSRVFINLGRNDNEIEVLFFLNLNSLNMPTLKMNIDCLKKWAEETQTKYNFQYFVCQIDNAKKDEYYFDSNGIGKLYNNIRG